MKKKFLMTVSVILLVAMCTVLLVSCAGSRPSMWQKMTGKYRSGKTGFDKGWSNDNNGYAKDGEVVEQLISVKPDERKLIHGDNDYYNFVHFGMNTMTDKEWGDGTETVDMFDPTGADTDQWVRVFKESGSDGVIFTAKHQDGFALWDSKVTDQIRIVIKQSRSNPYIRSVQFYSGADKLSIMPKQV